VSAQVKVKGETFLADLAFVRSLASVNQLVPLKFRIVQKLFTALIYRTDEQPLAMCNLMLSERSLVGEHFLAVLYGAHVHFLATAFIFHLYRVIFVVKLHHHLQFVVVILVQLFESSSSSSLAMGFSDVFEALGLSCNFI